MEKEHWFIRATRWSWTPNILGAVTGVGIVAALPAEAGAAAAARAVLAGAPNNWSITDGGQV